MSDEDKRKAHAQAQEAQEIFDKMGLLLVGKDPQVQGAAIALMLGTFLAGHFVTSKKDGSRLLHETRDWRAKVLALTASNALKHAAAQDEQRDHEPEARQ
jgi:hypothetical protein